MTVSHGNLLTGQQQTQHGFSIQDISRHYPFQSLLIFDPVNFDHFVRVRFGIGLSKLPGQVKIYAFVTKSRGAEEAAEALPVSRF